eukprot:7845672-Prorocentrum_lima.AAC.1
MTSSLVGSEMCIRDRPGHSRRAVSVAPPLVRPMAMALWRDGEEDHGAVSYTHLTLPTICSV